MVWVFPGILPANIKVAPNSPRERAKERMIPAIIPGQARGTVTRQKICHSGAPRCGRHFIRFYLLSPRAVWYQWKATTVEAITVLPGKITVVEFEQHTTKGPMFPEQQ